MPLKAPTYVPVAQIASMPLAHEWDDDDPYPLFPDVDEDIEELLSKVSDRAKFAFAIACAEWVVYRFSKESKDPAPFQFIQACWAVEMSDDFESPDESEDEEWEGPIRGPIDLALMTILNTFYASEDDDAEEEAAFAELVALHVLPDQSAFIEWRDAVLKKLVAQYPYRKKDPMGEPVPREDLDPRLQFDKKQRAELVEAYIAGLPKKSNPFLLRSEDE